MEVINVELHVLFILTCGGGCGTIFTAELLIFLLSSTDRCRPPPTESDDNSSTHLLASLGV